MWETLSPTNKINISKGNRMKVPPNNAYKKFKCPLLLLSRKWFQIIIVSKCYKKNKCVKSKWVHQL